MYILVCAVVLTVFTVWLGTGESCRFSENSDSSSHPDIGLPKADTRMPQNRSTNNASSEDSSPGAAAKRGLIAPDLVPDAPKGEADTQTLHVTAHLVCRVSDDEGKPVKGAHITLRWHDTRKNLRPGPTATTDSMGIAQYHELDPGYYYATVTSERHEETSMELGSLTPGSHVRAMRIDKLPTGGTVECIVRTVGSGQALCGSLVLRSSEDRGPVFVHALDAPTHREGPDLYFQFLDVPRGQYTIEPLLLLAWPITPCSIPVIPGDPPVLFHCDNTLQLTECLWTIHDAQNDQALKGALLVLERLDTGCLDQRTPLSISSSDPGRFGQHLAVSRDNRILWAVTKVGFRSEFGELARPDRMAGSIVTTVRMGRGWARRIHVVREADTGLVGVPNATVLVDDSVYGLTDNDGLLVLSCDWTPDRICVTMVTVNARELSVTLPSDALDVSSRCIIRLE